MNMRTTYPPDDPPLAGCVRPIVDPFVEWISRRLGLDGWDEERLRTVSSAVLILGLPAEFGIYGAIVALPIAVHLFGIAPGASEEVRLLSAAAIVAIWALGTVLTRAAFVRMYRRIQTAIARNSVSFTRLREALVDEEAVARTGWRQEERHAAFWFLGRSFDIALEGDGRDGLPQRVVLLRTPEGPLRRWIAVRPCCHPWRANPGLDLGRDRDLHAFADTFIAIAERHKPPGPEKRFDPSLN